jgi:hypothetical protein
MLRCQAAAAARTWLPSEHWPELPAGQEWLEYLRATKEAVWTKIFDEGRKCWLLIVSPSP